MINKAKRNHLNFEDWKKKSLRDPKIRAEYDKLEPEFAVIEAILEARVKKGMTQEQIAKKVGTKQSAIARLESGNYNPSLDFLKKVTRALDARIQITAGGR